MTNPREISCLEAITVLQELLDGALEGVPAAEVRAHLQTCAQCWPHLRFEQAFRDAVARATRGGGAPPELKRRIADLLAEARGAGSEPPEGPAGEE